MKKVKYEGFCSSFTLESDESGGDSQTNILKCDFSQGYEVYENENKLGLRFDGKIEFEDFVEFCKRVVMDSGKNTESDSLERFEISDETGEKRIEWYEENNGSKAYYSVPYDMLPESTPYVMLRFAKEKVRDDFSLTK